MYTNLMARENLLYAAEHVVASTAQTGSAHGLVHKTRLGPSSDGMKQAADRMYVPYDERLKINPQDDHFLEQSMGF